MKKGKRFCSAILAAVMTVQLTACLGRPSRQDLEEGLYQIQQITGIDLGLEMETGTGGEEGTETDWYVNGDLMGIRPAETARSVKLCVPITADLQCFVNFQKNLMIQMTYFIFQPLFVNGRNCSSKTTESFARSYLSQFNSTCVGSFALCICEVIAAQITVGLCRFPILF